MTTVRASLDIAHCLDSSKLTPEENFQVYGKCNRKGGHGHRWTVSVTVANVTESVLTTLVKEAIENNFDHRNLNLSESCPHMAGIVPTVENFAYVAVSLLKTAMLQKGLNPLDIKRIRVFETRTGSTTWDPTPYDIEHLNGRLLLAGTMSDVILPTMSVTKRVELWHEPGSVPADLDAASLWRVEGPGAGVSAHAVHFDLTFRGHLNLDKGMVENLCTVKDVLLEALKKSALKDPKDVSLDDLACIFEQCKQVMIARYLDPSLVYQVHWEYERTSSVQTLALPGKDSAAADYRLHIRQCTYPTQV